MLLCTIYWYIGVWPENIYLYVETQKSGDSPIHRYIDRALCNGMELLFLTTALKQRL